MSVNYLYVFFGKMSVPVCPFLTWVVCFLGVEFDKFIIDFGYLTLFQICHLQISSPILSVAFYFCLLFLHCADFYLDKVLIVHFSHSEQCEVVSQCGFDLYFPDDE